MTKNINNNEIETIEGTYVETIENDNQYDNQYNEQPKKTKRKFLKPLIIGALAVVVTGGVGAYAYDKYETAQRTKIQDAYSNIKLNTGNQTNSNDNNNSGNNNSNNNNNQNNNAQQNTQNVKSQQEIRSIVADAISVPEQNINFVKIKPKYEDDYAPQNNGVSLYVYKVEAKANGLEFDVVVDAVSGKVLKVKIDD